MDKKASAPPDLTRIRVININKKRFVVGLQWRTVKSQRNVMKEIKQIGKRDKLDVVAIRQSDAIQAGFAPKSNLKLRGSYSLIVSLASLLEGCCIAVIPVGTNGIKKEYTLVGRTEKGGIHPYSDEIYLEDEIEQTVIDLKAALRGNRSELEIKIFGDTTEFLWATDSLELESILTVKNLSKDFKLKPLTWGMTKKQIIILLLVLMSILVSLYFVSRHYDEIDRKKQVMLLIEQQRQAEINKTARYKAALAKLSHPWIEKTSAQDFLEQCNSMLYKFDLSIKGWMPTVVNCSDKSISVAYARMANSSAKTIDFVDAVKSMFDVPVDFTYKDTSVSTFSLPIVNKPNGDDPLQDMSVQLLKMISLFQGVNIDVSFGEVPIKDVKTNEMNETLPLQDWQEYTFEFNSAIPPRMIFKDTDLTGVRITNILISKDSGGMKYNVKGEIYGKR